MIFTTEIYDEILKRYNLGYPFKKSEQFEYRRIGGTRKSGIKFAHTQEELLEYAKCATDIIYFIEKYCKIMSPEGFGNIKLWDYQKKVIRNYQENKFNIFFTSRQVGMTSLMSLIFLHHLTFNVDKTITCMDIINKYNKQFIEKIKSTYKSLPFFLKQGILKWSNDILGFENGCSIRTWTANKNLAVGYIPEILYMSNFSRMRDKKYIYENLLPVITARKGCRFIIHSGPYGYDFFYELVRDSERFDGDPKKNIFKTQRIYWWQVPGRDEKWKEKMIELYGIEVWHEEFDLQFVTYWKEDKKRKK